MTDVVITTRTDLGPLIDGATGKWEVVIGMEVHAQVLSKAKLFSGASAAFGADPNEHVSFVDAAMPGMLPVINKYCVEQAVRTGLGLNASSPFPVGSESTDAITFPLPPGWAPAAPSPSPSLARKFLRLCAKR